MKFSHFIPIFLIIFGEAKSATLLEKSYEYVMNLGKSVAPNFMSIIDCMSEKEVWNCAREKAGKILDGWDEEVQQERKKWQEEADSEVRSSGRSFEELPSKLGDEVETSLNSLVELAHHGMARALSSTRKHHESGGIDSITISTGSGDKKKIKKKKPKPPKIHLVHPMMMPLRKMEKGRNFPNGRQTWVIGDRVESSNFGDQNSNFGHESSSYGQDSSKSGDENRPRALNSDESSSIGDLSIDLSKESSSRSEEDSYPESSSNESSSLSNENSIPHKSNIPGDESSVPSDESSIPDDGSSIPSDESSIPKEESSIPSEESSLPKEESSNPSAISSSPGTQSSSIGVNEGRGVFSDLWKIGEQAIDAVAEHALETEAKDNGIEDKSSIAEQRGKKKKKKKAILKLLILGAVLKAKIGTLLQILSFKLQVKFFIVAVLGLAINLARLWIDLKNKHSHQPQKVIYYEHAQHQHHYDHEEEHDHGGWGPWSRSAQPEDETDVQVDVDLHNSPYRAQERLHNFPRKYT